MIETNDTFEVAVLVYLCGLSEARLCKLESQLPVHPSLQAFFDTVRLPEMKHIYRRDGGFKGWVERVYYDHRRLSMCLPDHKGILVIDIKTNQGEFYYDNGEDF